MKISVTDAKAQLTELVRRAEAGEEVVLTRFGRSVIRLVPLPAAKTAAERRVVMDKAWALGKAAKPGPKAARSQDELYDEDGLPA